MPTTLVNLTPLVISIHHDNGVLTLPSEGDARVNEVRRPDGYLFVNADEQIPVTSVSYGEVTGLPDPVDGTVYVVSLLVRAALPGRKDLASPGPLVRDATGVITGCKGLTM
jgi:hypothetical protein